MGNAEGTKNWLLIALAIVLAFLLYMTPIGQNIPFLGWILTAAAGLLALAVITGKITVGMSNMPWAVGANLVAAVVGILVVTGTITPMNLFKGSLEPAAALPGAATPAIPASPAVPAQPAAQPQPQPAVTSRQVAINKLSVQMQERGSNSYTTVGTAQNGTLDVYEAGVDPRSATAKAIVQVNVSAGVGSKTGPNLKTDTPYRVVYNGGCNGCEGLHYDKDYGTITFAYADYQANTGESLFQSKGIGGALEKVTVVDNLANATILDGTINGNTQNNGVNELNGSATDKRNQVLLYNESAGDEQYFFDITPGFSGANTFIQQPVLCYEFDSSNPPESTEVTAISVQLKSGTDFGLPSDQANQWKQEACMDIKVSGNNVVEGGKSATYKYTVTVVESNMENAGDVWKLVLDDLGAINGKSVINNKGAIASKITFDSNA